MKHLRWSGLVFVLLTVLVAGCSQPGPGDSSTPTITAFTAAVGALDHISASVTATDNVVVTSVTVSVDGGAATAATKGAGDTWTWLSAAPFAVGAHEVGAAARDAAGNTTTATPITVIVGGSVPATQVTAGLWSSMALAVDGTVHAWGSNFDGRLGLGDDDSDRDTPERVAGLASITSLAGSTANGFAVDANGDAYSWGNSSLLGFAATEDGTEPAAIPGLTDIVQIATGGAHALALDANGTVYGWGDNLYGQLGLGFTNPNYFETPQQITGLNGVVITMIAAGDSHSMALAATGDVYTWGRGASGRLGLGDTDNRSVPTLIGTLNDIMRIAAGDNHSLAGDVDGNLYVWGDNGFGQLGLDDANPRNAPEQLTALADISRITAGHNNSFAVDGDGNLYAWGQNTTGELGLGDDVERDEPEQVSGIAGVAWVAASAFHTVAVDGDGNVYAWGRNDNGELGMGDVVERDTPTLVSYFGGS